MTTATHTDFPSAETLAAFIDGRLDPETRKRVLEHMVTCETCYPTFLMASEMRAQEGAGTSSVARSSHTSPGDGKTPGGKVVRGSFGRKALIGIPAAFAAAAVLVVLFREPIREEWDRYTLSRKTGIEALVAAAEHLDTRNVEPRLSGGFVYKGFKGPNRGKDEEDLRQWRLQLAAGVVKDGALKHPDAARMHELAIALLLEGHWDNAVDAIEGSLKKATGRTSVMDAVHTSNDPKLLSDAAAAYLARFKNLGMGESDLDKDHAGDVADALECARAALRLQPDLPEAVFNEALALEELHLDSQAKSAWRRYTALDSGSGWANDAKEHLRELESHKSVKAPTKEEYKQWVAEALDGRPEQIVASGPRLTRQYLEDEAIPKWGELELAGLTQDARRLLLLIESQITDLREMTGDDGLSDTTAVISKLESNARRSDLDALARAFISYRRARREKQYAVANSAFRKAAETFRNLGVPFASLTGVYVATNEAYRGEYAQAQQEIETTSMELRFSLKYPSTVARLQWINGLVLLAKQQPWESLRAYDAARKAFVKIGDVDDAGFLDCLIAENLESLGEWSEAWRHRIDAFSALHKQQNLERLQLALNESAEACLNNDRWYAAELLQNASRELAVTTNDAEQVSYAHLWSSLAALKHDRPLAVQALRAARASAAGIEDSAARRRSESDIDAADALLNLADDPRRAIDLLSAALATHEAFGNHLRLAQFHLILGRADKAIGNRSDALAHFQAGIKESLAVAGGLDDHELRGAYFGRIEDLYDEVIEALLLAGQSARALRYADLRRERLYGLCALGTSLPTGDDADITSNLPQDTTIFSYVLLPDALVVWRADRAGIRTIRKNLTRRVVVDLADRWTSSIRTNAETSLVSQEITSVLLEPLFRGVPAGQSIIFVPDEALMGIPFAALRAPQTGRFLMQDHSVLTGLSCRTSTNYFRAANLLTESSRALVVAPEGNRGSEQLPRLAGTLDEAIGLSNRFRSTLLTDRAATTTRFLELAPTFAMIHFAGHSRANRRRPSSSALVFADDGATGARELHADEIRRIPFRSSRLVVLSSCSSAVAANRNEATPSIAAAFIAAGVPVVVGSLWDVNDAHTAQFLRTFYDVLRRQHDPSGALREAQIAGIARPIASWASFQIVVGFERKES